jgi:hypothetical protein
MFSAWSVPRGYKRTKKVELVVENLVEFWRWRSRVTEKK